MDVIWVFNGGRNQFPSAVFRSQENAEKWIEARRLTGTLTENPVDMPVYDWAIAHDFWYPKQAYQTEPPFIANFSSAHLRHHHYEDGHCED